MLGEPDERLVAMIAQDRDRAAAEAELCRRYRHRVYLYGVRHLRDSAAAEDLVQDVLSTVIERVRAGGVNEPEKIGSFVLGTSRLQTIGRKRSEARRARILATYPDARVDDVTSDASVDAPALARLADCLSRLGDRDRTVLLLSFYAELDPDALARELGLAASHVRVVRHRALGRLQKCVKGEGET